jgi:ATP-dependent DNA helicase RecQ
MTTSIHEQGLLLLRQALDNSTADFRSGQWEAIAQLWFFRQY